MLTIPLYIFLILYFVFLFIFALFIIININHLFQTAALTFTSLLVTLIVISAAMIAVWLTWNLLQNINWNATITVFDSSWIKNIFSFSSPANISQ